MPNKTTKTTTARNALLSRMVEKPDPNASVVKAVRELIAEQLEAVETARHATNTAQENLDKARITGFTARGDMMIALGTAATAGKWDIGLVKTGIAEAIIPYAKRRNMEAKSFNTFKSEMLKAMTPGVREKIVEVFTLAQTAFDNSRKQLEGKRPLFDQFSRAYHVALNGIMPALVKGDPMPTEAQLHATAAAKAAAKPTDPNIARKAMVAIQKRLEALFVEFPHDDIAAMVKFAKTIDAKELQAAHDRKTAPKVNAAALTAARKGKRHAPPIASDVGAAIEETLAGV